MADEVMSVPKRSRASRIAAAVLLVAVAAGITVGIVPYMSGARWFMVETPSMGTTAPVGTLVITTPEPIASVQVGDVIAFRPPTEPTRVYTHRVFAITPDGLETRGDINGAIDGWRIQQHDLIGTAVALIPGVGFLLRALPMLVAGNAVVWLLTRVVRAPAQRASLRTIGFHLVAAIPAFVLHPFVQILVLQTQAAGNRISATIVSTGLLPVQVTATDGQHLELHAGQVGSLALPVTTGGYHLSANLDLTLPEVLLLVGICLLPVAWTLIVGLPDSDGVEAEASTPHADREQNGPPVVLASSGR